MKGTCPVRNLRFLLLLGILLAASGCTSPVVGPSAEPGSEDIPPIEEPSPGRSGYLSSGTSPHPVFPQPDTVHERRAYLPGGGLSGSSVGKTILNTGATGSVYTEVRTTEATYSRVFFMDGGETVEAWISFRYGFPVAEWSVRAARPGDTSRREIRIERDLDLRPSGTLKLPASGDLADHLPGTFEGAYWYEGLDERYLFVIRLMEYEGGLAGYIEEPGKNLGTGSDPETSVVEGSVTGRTISFVKTYDGNGDQIRYAGEYQPESGEIGGEWIFGDRKGGFLIVIG